MKGQLEFATIEGYEVEHLNGATAPAFAVVVQPCSGGAVVQAPEWLDWRCWVDDAGVTHVELHFST